jgi:NTE family protein
MSFVTKEADSGPVAAQAAEQKIVNLALQGGGSHGAFSWGVLDRLLEEERLSFEGISATSAGAVNAVVLADLLGRRGARGKNALRRYWQKVSELVLLASSGPRCSTRRIGVLASNIRPVTCLLSR